MSTKITIAKSAEGFPLLGWVVYWTIRSFRVTIEEAEAKFAAAGVPTDYLAKILTKSALSKAVRSAAKGREGVFSRKVLDDASAAGYLIVQSESDSINKDQLGAKFFTETRAVYDKDTKTAKVEGLDREQIVQEFESLKSSFTSDMLRTSVLRALRLWLKGVAIRDNGGVYFVPSAHEVEFRAFQELFKQFGCEVSTVPVVNTEQARVAAWKSFSASVEAELGDILKAVKDKGTSASERYVTSRVDDLNDVKERVLLYSELLQFKSDDLKLKLKEVEVAVGVLSKNAQDLGLAGGMLSAQ